MTDIIDLAIAVVAARHRTGARITASLTAKGLRIVVASSRRVSAAKRCVQTTSVLVRPADAYDFIQSL